MVQQAPHNTAALSVLVAAVAVAVVAGISNGHVIGTKQDYCAIHQNHTLCIHKDSVSAACGRVVERGLSDSERELVVRLHNERRAFVANGREERGDPGPQPPAANMMQMTYDSELELEAQTWADQCIGDHDCPECRDVARFKVGQNLYLFGHFSGSWERSVEGWYDEVADFNSTFIDPFFIPRGVLVGHYTQLIWAQTHKIGCGKVFSFPDGSRFGQQLYICNYGLAGNLIKSELYAEGPACSACPSGTACSAQHPGLCSGTPDQPLTVRPPIHVDLRGLEGLGRVRTADAAPPSFEVVEGPVVPVNVTSPLEGAACEYTCELSGGCMVRLVTTGGFVSGNVLGSCFPKSFGGACSGTPKSCHDCSDLCQTEKQGVVVTVKIDSKGEELSRTSSALPSASPSESSAPPSSDTCAYSCEENGSCSVRLNAATLTSGSVMGSCFSAAFGGACNGTPNGCSDCLAVCDQKGKGQHTLNKESGK